MPDSFVAAALARGALVVTPNKRLAREIASAYDRAQAAAGRVTWPAVRVLPWMTFVSRLVQRAQDAALKLPALSLDAEQAEQIWRRVIEADLADAPLVSVDAMAQTAIEAWELAHAYGATSESWRGISGTGPDVEAFARWATAFARETARLDALDGARAPDAVAAVAAALPGVSEIDAVVVGFIELAPQQERLLAALSEAGASVTRATFENEVAIAPNARLAQADTPRNELIAAFDWAREQAESDGSAQVAIVVQDLPQRRALVRSIAEDRLCPDRQRPGEHNAPRPYDISLGVPLASVPLVLSALDLLALAQRPLERDRAIVVVRSPYLPEAASRWIQRAALERRWLEVGVATVSLRDFVVALRNVDERLATRWHRIVETSRAPSSASPRAWVEHWRRLLDDFGWAQDSALDTAEFQAQSAWNELLAAFARLSAVSPQLRRDEALATLVRLAGEQLFQPEARGARIRVLGLLESTGLSFDALWITGMAADAWPRPPAPNPLLPLRWQRERNVPRSSASQELAFARRVTALLSRAAPRIVFSYASQADEHVRAPSPLIAKLPRLEVRAERTTAERLLMERPPFVRLADPRAPAVAPGAVLPGGTGAIEDQSMCAFRFVVRHRLRAPEWPQGAFGLTYLERGALVHEAMAALWRDLRDHASLVSLSQAQLDARVRAAAATAMSAIGEARWAAIPPAVAQSESACIETLMHDWLALERQRPPFTVIASEVKTPVTLAGYSLNVRLDRVDALASGGVAIIDYKSGQVGSVSRWFDARPQALQLAVYAAAHGQREPAQEIQALVYGRLRRGEVAAIGLAASEAVWPDVGVAETTKIAGEKLADWNDARSRLDAAMVRLVTASGEGEAGVVPREAKVCRLCHLHAVCRVRAAVLDDAAEDAGSLDDA